MTVFDIAPRRKSRMALTFMPPPPQGIEGAEYEGERLLIDKKIISRCDIKKGTELELEDVKQLIFVSECYRAKNRAVWLLSGQDYSEKSLYNKLLKSFTEKASAFAVAQMKNKGYVDDRRYAKALVEKYKNQNMSLRQIKEKLMLKGVPGDVSAEILGESELPPSEVDRAVALIKSKYKNKISSEDERKKTFQALMRRGFLYSDIKKAMELSCNTDCFDEEIY